MKHYLLKKSFVPCIFMAGAIVFAGCTDNDFDFNGIDMTVGLGGDGLSLPVSSTDTIKLADVLELDGTECVVVKPNGDYVFEQTGDDVEPARPEIGVVTVSQNSVESVGIPVTITPGSVSGSVSFPVSGEVLKFTYSGEKPEEVVSLDHVGVDAEMVLNITFPDVMKIDGLSIGEMEIELPAFMEIGNASASSPCTVQGSRLVLTNVPVDRVLNARIAIEGLNFKATDTSLGSIRIDGNNNIVLDATVKTDLKVTINNTNISGGGTGNIMASLQLGDIELNSATGRFNPTIDLDNLGSVEVTGVPDFLTDGNVVVDLYNPQILLSIDNDMDVHGFVDGTITAVKDGMKTEINVDDIKIKPNGVTKVCICRRSEGIDAGQFDEVKVIGNLSDLIRTIPDRIEFSANAMADATQTANIELGHPYNIKPSYSIEAPITFDEDARIVYTDSIDGWNNDINDLELADDSYISLSTAIENRVPAYLSVKVDPIDVDGNVIDENEISVKVTPATLQASEDGENSKVTPINIEIRQGEKGALKRLDGIAFRIEGGASVDGSNPVVGKTLNSEKHFLIARDIVVKLVGKVIGDFN